jgi:hypothetical protein
MRDSSESTYVVSEADRAKYRSPYLAGGYKQDEFVLRDIIVSESKARATCDVVNHYVPSDGTFHFTIPLAFLVVGELAIIGAHVNSGVEEKLGEVFLVNFSIACHRPVQKTRDIAIELTLGTRTPTTLGLFYEGTIAIDTDGFTGSGTFLFPVPSGSAEPGGTQTR